MAQGGQAGATLFAGGDSGFVREHQAALLRRFLPRARGATLLEVNCGEGGFLPLYQQAGFASFAVERDCELREKVVRAHRGVEIYPAGAEDLPFDDKGMDWVVLHLRNDEAIKCVLECLRVANRGCLISFWNSASLAGLCCKLGGKAESLPWPRSAPAMWRLLRAQKAGRLSSRSTLLLPAASWSRNCVIASWNSLLEKTLLGAWCVIRIDLGRPGLGTPIGLPLATGISKPMPAMEYSQKISGCQKDITES